LKGDADWGMRRLSFEIDHRREAQYHLFQFEGTPEVLTQLDRSLSIDDSVLRHRIIRLPEIPDTTPKAPEEGARRSSEERGPSRDGGRDRREPSPDGETGAEAAAAPAAPAEPGAEPVPSEPAAAPAAPAEPAAASAPPDAPLPPAPSEPEAAEPQQQPDEPACRASARVARASKNLCRVCGKEAAPGRRVGPRACLHCQLDPRREQPWQPRTSTESSSQAT
jgi:hypothetical protein